MSLKKTDVEGYKVDDKQHTVINTNTTEYNQYMERRRRIQNDKLIYEKLNTLENRLKEVEQTLAELAKKVT